MKHCHASKHASKLAVAVSLIGTILLPSMATPPAALAQPERDVDLAAIAQLADRYFEVKNEAVVSDAAHLGIDEVPMTMELRQATQELMDKLQERRKQLAFLGERYSSSETETTVIDADQTGNQLAFTVSEKTYLFYEKVFGDEPEFTAYEIEHSFTASQVDGTWTLSSDSIDTSALLPITLISTAGESTQEEIFQQPIFDTQDAYSSATVQFSSASVCGVYKGCDPSDVVSGMTKFSPSLLTQRPLQPVTPEVGRPPKASVLSGGFGEANTTAVPPSGLNYNAMVDYAVKYWDVYNTNYRSFTNDCTNFISQALRAGGWRNDYGWYRSSSNWWYHSGNQTFTWAGAENWSRFAPKRTLHLENVWMLVNADILQMDFDKNNNINHTMIVTKRASRTPYLTYHTTDTLNRSLNSLLTAYPNAWYYAYRT